MTVSPLELNSRLKVMSAMTLRLETRDDAIVVLFGRLRASRET